tara:strand:- start:159 stop:860 length:702 start_codon:yes stop_codon:yes gene_type:complete
MGLSSKVSSFDEMLKRIVKESIEGALSQPSHSEEDKQADLARRLQSVGKSHSREVLMDEEEDETPAKKDKDPEGEKEDSKEKFVGLDIPAEIKFQDIRKMIDQLRSGKSLKDADTKMQLVDYYDGLDEPDRIALYKFLGAISAILTKDVEGSEIQAPDQGKGKVDVRSKTKVKAPDPNKKKIAKRSKQQKADQQKKKEKTQTSSPEKEFDAPIKVGESQDKNDVIVEMSRLVI